MLLSVTPERSLGFHVTGVLVITVEVTLNDVDPLAISTVSVTTIVAAPGVAIVTVADQPVEVTPERLIAAAPFTEYVSAGAVVYPERLPVKVNGTPATTLSGVLGDTMKVPPVVLFVGVTL